MTLGSTIGSFSSMGIRRANLVRAHQALKHYGAQKKQLDQLSQLIASFQDLRASSGNTNLLIGDQMGIVDPMI